MTTPPTDNTWAVLRSYLLSYVRRHAGNLVSQHEDFVQDALMTVMRVEAERCQDFPDQHGDKGLLRIGMDEARKLGVTVMKRRIIDHHRRSRAKLFSDLSFDVDSIKSDAEVEQRVVYEALLKACIKRLVTYSQKERDVLTRYLTVSPNAPLEQNLRKRMSRLRKRLRSDLEKDLGMSLRELLSIPADSD